MFYVGNGRDRLGRSGWYDARELCTEMDGLVGTVGTVGMVGWDGVVHEHATT